MKETTENTIRVERARHKITQAELASAIGCSNQTINAIENGKMSPGLTIAMKIVRYFNELRQNTSLEALRVEDIFKLKSEL